MSLAITGQDVRDAAVRIQPLARRTPVLPAAEFGAFFKCENLQLGGAFKIRGAANLILSLPADVQKKGLVAFSSGNHAQAVALASRHVGAHAIIVMPEDAPKSKLDATRRYGAEVITYNRFTQNRETIARDVLDKRGGTLVPPFDHPMIMAGQGTAGLELLEEVPEIDALLTPVGGGGLLSGCATIAKTIRPELRVFGVEPEGGKDTFLSFMAGERISHEPNTIADGLRAPKPGALTFPVMRALAERILLVTDDEIKSTVKYLLTELKIVVEASGATAAAAVLHRKLPKEIRRPGVILSGGNIDFDQLASY